MINNKYYRIDESGYVLLYDGEISEGIHKAKIDFDDGAIIECMNTLKQIYNALMLFVRQEETKYDG